MLAAAENRLPRPRPVGAAEHYRSSASTGTGSPPRVWVDVLAPAGAELAVFAEGPTQDWALPLPERLPARRPDDSDLSLRLTAAARTKPDGATLRLTAVAARAIETTYRLD